MIEIAEMLPPRPTSLWRLARQCGIKHAVGVMDMNGRIGNAFKDDLPWSYVSLERLQAAYGDGGFELSVIESRPPMDKIKLGLPGRDEEIKAVCDMIRNMGSLGIPVWCYEWMPVLNWIRTSTSVPSRGGALVTGYDHELMCSLPAIKCSAVSEEQLWDNLESFLERVVPVAEKANVKLAMHPDDPPISPIRGLSRIMYCTENFQRLIDLYPSPVNGIAFCQGAFTLMSDDLPAVIRRFGEQKRIFYVHFRDVRGTAESFVETFHDDGKTDMVACMEAYHEIDYEGVCRADHVPTMEGDSNANPGYSQIGRLYAIGYIKGLREAVYKRNQTDMAAKQLRH